jgi:hypothetical protein
MATDVMPTLVDPPRRRRRKSEHSRVGQPRTKDPRQARTAQVDERHQFSVSADLRRLDNPREICQDAAVITYPRRSGLSRYGRGDELSDAELFALFQLRFGATHRVRTGHTPILRSGGLTGLAVILIGVFGLLGSVAVGLAVMFFGFAIFLAANFAAYEDGEGAYIVGPAMAAMGSFSALCLSLVMVIAAID